MAVIPLFKSAAFAPEVLSAMAEAYEHACRGLNDDVADFRKEAIAKAIIELAQRGIHDASELRRGAIEAVNTG